MLMFFLGLYLLLVLENSFEFRRESTKLVTVLALVAALVILELADRGYQLSL